MNKNKQFTPMQQLKDHFKIMNSLVYDLPEPYCLHRQEPRRGFDWGGHRVGARKGVHNDFVKIYQNHSDHADKQWSIAFEFNYLNVSPTTVCVNKRNGYGETSYSKTFEQNDFRLLMNKFNKLLKDRVVELGIKKLTQLDFILIFEDLFLGNENGINPKELEVNISSKRKECEAIWNEHLSKLKTQEVEKNKFLNKRNTLEADISAEIFNSKESQRIIEINRQILELNKEKDSLCEQINNIRDDKQKKAKIAGISNHIIAIENDMKAINQTALEQIHKAVSDLPSAAQRNLIKGVTGINVSRNKY